MFAPTSSESGRRVVYVSSLYPESGRWVLSPAPMLCWHPPHVPVAIGIQRAIEGSFMRPTSFHRAVDAPSHLHRTERPAGPLVHSKSRLSDPRRLPRLRPLYLHANVAPQQQPALNRVAGRPLSFIQNRVLAILATSPVSRPSDHLHLHPNVAPQQPHAPNRPAGKPSRSFKIVSQ